MAEKQAIIIKKIQGGSHAGAHGGAWKVAYADFVTAMMAFFLVMWLLGADEETKAAISHYFNHPNTPYKAGKDPKSEVVNPLGEKDGQGKDILRGLEGFWPDDLIDRPRSHRDIAKEVKTISRMLEDLLEGKIYGVDTTASRVNFSLPESVLFEANSAQLTAEARIDLDVVGQVLKGFSGNLTIEGHAEETQVSGRYKNIWELSMARAVAVMDYLNKKHKFDEKRMLPLAAGSRRGIASSSADGGRKKNRRVSFSLGYDSPESGL